MWTGYLSHSICCVRDQRAMTSLTQEKHLTHLRLYPSIVWRAAYTNTFILITSSGKQSSFSLTCFLAKFCASPRVGGVRMLVCVMSLFVSAALLGLLEILQGPTAVADWSDRQSNVIRIWWALGVIPYLKRFKKRNVTLRPHLGKETGSYSGPDRPAAFVCGERTCVGPGTLV